MLLLHMLSYLQIHVLFWYDIAYVWFKNAPWLMVIEKL